MKTSAVACFLVAAIAIVRSAPAATEVSDSAEVSDSVEVQRTKRSQYGSPPPYISPCSAAPAPAPYHIMPAIHAGGYGMGHGYSGGYGGYGGPHYRADSFADESEMLRFDMEHGDHLPMMRAYGGYEAPAPSHGGYGGGYGGASHIAIAQTPAGPAMGYFPNANVGGCNVPLLLSCAPSITPGRIVKSQSSYSAPSQPSYSAQGSSTYTASSQSAAPASAGAPAYRGADSNLKNLHPEDHHMEGAADHHSAHPENSGQILNHQH